MTFKLWFLYSMSHLHDDNFLCALQVRLGNGWCWPALARVMLVANRWTISGENVSTAHLSALCFPSYSNYEDLLVRCWSSEATPLQSWDPWVTTWNRAPCPPKPTLGLVCIRHGGTEDVSCCSFALPTWPGMGWHSGTRGKVLSNTMPHISPDLFGSTFACTSW